MVDERDVWKHTWSGVAWARIAATTRRLRRRTTAAIASELRDLTTLIEVTGAR